MSADKFIGIDPGKNGSIAVIHQGSLYVFPVPIVNDDYDPGKMYELLMQYKDNAFAVLERASAMPGQGVSSMFHFGRGYGMWLALLAVAGIPHQVVHPRVWTKVMLAGAPGDGKDRAVAVAKRLFPSWQVKFKYELEWADSILLAEYARRIYK